MNALYGFLLILSTILIFPFLTLLRETDTFKPI